MLNRSASLAMSTSILKAFPGKLDIKRHSPSILSVGLFKSNPQGKSYMYHNREMATFDALKHKMTIQSCKRVTNGLFVSIIILFGQGV